jgi:hypothetical protein
MPLTPDARRELEERVMTIDATLETKQAFWETPRNIALLLAAVAAIIGGIAGVLGYKIGQNSPPTQIIFQPRSIVVPASK